MLAGQSPPYQNPWSEDPQTPLGTPPRSASPATTDEDDGDKLPVINTHPMGPLRVLRGNNKTQGLYRWHYATATNQTVGCNIALRPDKCTPIDTTLDYIHLLSNSRECAACGRQSRVPTKWIRALSEAPNRATRMDSDTDDSSTTTTNDETDSEAPVINGE